jgi:hypothetical protein
MKKAVIAVVILGMIAAAVAWGLARRASQSGVPLRIVFSSATFGHLGPTETPKGLLGGFARTATMVKGLAGPNTFMVDTGEFVPKEFSDSPA